MSDPVEKTPSPPAGEPKAGESPEKAQGNEPKYVSLAEYEKLVKRLDGQSAIIETLRKGKEAPPEPKPEPDLIQRVNALEDRDKKVTDREKKHKDREVLRVIEDTLKEGGVDPKQAPRFAKLIQTEQADKIVVDDDMNVSYVESEGKKAPMKDWVGAYLQTDDGKTLFPAKRNPGGNLNPDNTTLPSGKKKVTKADFQSGKYDAAAWKAGKLELVD